MKHSFFANIEYSKKLGWLFPEADYLWVEKFPCFSDKNKVVSREVFKDRLENSTITLSEQAKKLIKFYPAITTDMALSVLQDIEYASHGFPCLQLIYPQHTKDWHVHFRNPPLEWSKKGSQEAGIDKKLSSAACKMILWLVEEGVIKDGT